MMPGVGTWLPHVHMGVSALAHTRIYQTYTKNSIWCLKNHMKYIGYCPQIKFGYNTVAHF